MSELPNLDRLDAIYRGEPEPPEPVKPHDTITQARCPLALTAVSGVLTANTLTGG